MTVRTSEGLEGWVALTMFGLVVSSGSLSLTKKCARLQIPAATLVIVVSPVRSLSL